MALSGSTARPNNIVGTFGSAIDPAVSDAAARHCPRRSRTPRPKRSARSARSAFAATLLSPSLATAGKASAEPSFCTPSARQQSVGCSQSQAPSTGISIAVGTPAIRALSA
jgi:hypothetical protein